MIAITRTTVTSCIYSKTQRRASNTHITTYIIPESSPLHQTKPLSSSTLQHVFIPVQTPRRTPQETRAPFRRRTHNARRRLQGAA